jgi:hypothetical protein
LRCNAVKSETAQRSRRRSLRALGKRGITLAVRSCEKIDFVKNNRDVNAQLPEAAMLVLGLELNLFPIDRAFCRVDAQRAQTFVARVAMRNHLAQLFG